MRQRGGKPSIILLVFLALLSLVFFYQAEKSQKPRKAEYYNEKIQAAELTQKAQNVVKRKLSEKGYVIDIQNDPNMTGLIGPQYSLITTDRGYIRDKLISTNPNAAAMLIDLYHRAGLTKGDKIAVTFSGSFPGMNIAVLAACKVMGLEPVIITSVGASTWGANWEEFTWLDIESALIDDGLWDYKSTAASIGGGNDHGRGLSPQGRDLILQAIARNNVELIYSDTEDNRPGSLESSIHKRIEIFDRAEGDDEYKAVVNVGGGLAAVGSSQNAKLMLPGLNRRLWEHELPARGAINILAERHIPAIHLLKMTQLAQKYGLPVNIIPEPEIGVGEIYVLEKYSITTTVIYTVVLLVIVWAAIRLDFRYYIYRNKHLFVKKNA
jgi:poly-gamma-glutamate system protein